MAALSLREAAEQAGVSKSTIFRAIQSGRMSATRTEDGNFAIDPAELFRVYEPRGERSAATRNEARVERQRAQALSDGDATELRIRNAQLDAEIRALRTLLDAEKERAAEIKSERDRWRDQAERLALSGPATAKGPLTTPRIRPEPRGWWPFRRAG